MMYLSYLLAISSDSAGSNRRQRSRFHNDLSTERSKELAQYNPIISIHNYNHSTAVYLRQPGSASTILTQYITLIILTSTPNLLSLPGLPVCLRVYTKENQGDTAERNVRIRGKAPTLPLHSPNSEIDASAQ